MNDGAEEAPGGTTRAAKRPCGYILPPDWAPMQEEPDGLENVLLADECKVPGCQNQRFRRRQYAKLEVFPTPGKGYGLRCATGERARATAVPRPRKVALDC